MGAFLFDKIGIRGVEVKDMNEEFDYSNIDLNSAAKELYGDVTPTTPVAPKTEETPVETTENEVETEENDNPFEDDAETKVDETPEEVDPDEETFKKLEAEEKWRTKRLNKEIEAKKAAEAETARLKAEIEALKGGKQATETAPQQDIQIDETRFKEALIAEDPYIKSLHEKVEYIKSVKESFSDMGAYADALLDAQSELKSEIKDRKREFINYQRQVQTQQNQGVNQILNDFNAKVESVKENYPMIDKAKALLESKAAELHVDIRKALLTDENAGELTWTIGASKKNLEFLIEASKIATRTGQSPIDALKMMGKWSNEIASGKPAAGTEAPKKAPVKPAGVPKSIKSKTVANHDDMDPYEYASKLLSGKIKNDLY